MKDSGKFITKVKSHIKGKKTILSELP